MVIRLQSSKELEPPAPSSWVRGCRRLAILGLLLAGGLSNLLVQGTKANKLIFNLVEDVFFVPDVMKEAPQDQINIIARELETSQTRYFVYDNPNMTEPDIQMAALSPSGIPTWKNRWGERYKEYSQGEIRFHQALQNHTLRTYNVSKAEVFVILIPICAIVYWGTPQHMESAVIATKENGGTLDRRRIWMRVPPASAIHETAWLQTLRH